MARSQAQSSKNLSRGFTIVEVLIATVVLIAGLLSAAALIGNSLGSTSRNEYLTQAATLASEKLEDLNRYPSSDPHIAVTSGTTAGSLTADLVQDVTSNGVTVPVNYYDEVFFSPSQGFVEETVSSLDSNGNPVYTTLTQNTNGSMTQSNTDPSLLSGVFGFKRRWLIEQDQPVVGLRRITVVVTLENQSMTGVAPFQMSTVRP
jgi:type II secretory pathway pseudopilin PulG